MKPYTAWLAAGCAVFEVLLICAAAFVDRNDPNVAAVGTHDFNLGFQTSLAHDELLCLIDAGVAAPSAVCMR
jgi:hypothetical protein